MKMRDSLAIGVVTVLWFAATPAFAQSNNGGVGNSNFGGVLNSGPPGVLNFGSPGSSGTAGYNSSVLDQARSLQQRLVDTPQACTGIRSFLRTPQPCTGNPELSQAKSDATAFLNSVQNPGPNLLGASSSSGAKFSPTW